MVSRSRRAPEWLSAVTKRHAYVPAKWDLVSRAKKLRTEERRANSFHSGEKGRVFMFRVLKCWVIAGRRCSQSWFPPRGSRGADCIASGPPHEALTFTAFRGNAASSRAAARASFPMVEQCKELSPRTDVPFFLTCAQQQKPLIPTSAFRSPMESGWRSSR